ncbi:hypothetical protein JD844_024656, partial [Phrynosoma platyrhinos]
MFTVTPNSRRRIDSGKTTHSLPSIFFVFSPTHYLQRNPPMVVSDLFEDIKDGIILIALLEVLSGQKLARKSNFSRSRIKLVNINSTDIADGRPSIVLGLVWTIILYFQIEELTSNLPQLQSLSSSTSSVDSVVSSETASPPSKRKVVTKIQGNAKKALLKWVQYTAAKQAGIEVKDFGRSWRSGVAFHSVIHAIRPELVDLERVKTRSNRENLEEAFMIAESELGIPRLLDPEDVDVDKPDEKSVMTYVAQFLKHYPDPHNAANDAQEADKEDRLMLRDLKIWVEQFERDLTRAQMMDTSLQEKYQSFKYYRVQYEVKRKQIELAIQSLRKDGKLSLDQALVKQAWDRVTSRLFEWHLHLDKSLPAPLGTIGAWLYQAETSLREEIIIQQAHEETANLIHRKIEQHKDVLKNIDGYKKTFQEIHRAQSVNGVPVPTEQLDDMAERFNFVASTSELHLLKMEFLELKYRLLSLLVLAESKLKSWIIKYGRRDSVELLLQNYMTVIENNNFFEQYEITYQILKKAADMYAKANGSSEEIESVARFMNETTTQWRHLSVEVRSVKSMLEEVISNWDRYSSTVASLQAWLEDAEKMLNQPEHAKKDFFRHLPQWIQQHTTMNDAGNFLIETCDETISRDLKQQLLLLNGRWRELFMQVKQYARTDELDRIRKEYLEGVATLSVFTDEVKRKLYIPLEVSFLNVKMFVQEMEASFFFLFGIKHLDTKQKVPVMESQYKMVTRTAQLVTKEIPQVEVHEMLATMSGIKGQLIKINESCPVVLYESQQLLPHLEELEKQITHFYESLEKVNEIISVLDPEVQPAEVFKQQHQDLVAYQENCKKALSLIERNSQSITKLLASSKVLHHFSLSVLQKKVKEIQAAFQNMSKKIDDWKKTVEANSRLMKKFEESRTELENVLQVAHCCLKERGNPEELLQKHTEFFSQLDQRVLNAFLKACDELTDILPEQEQHTLQEAVRKLHKQWKDLQSEAPYHLLRLKIEVEKNKFLESVQECHTELARQQDLMSKESSEKIIREHKLFFGDNGPLQLCEKRLHLIKELCLKLPEWDPLKKISESSQKHLNELKSQVSSTYAKLMDHPDKWKDYKNRFSELENWISSRESQLKKIKHGATDTAKYKHFKTSIEEIRQEACKQGETLIWLKSRLAALSEVSSKDENKKQEDELSKLSNDFKRILTLLPEIEKTLGAVGDCVQYTEEVKGHLVELITNSKEAQEEIEKILDVESLLQAQQLLRYHQQKTKRLHVKRQDVQQQIARGKQLQMESGLSPTGQEDLWKLEGTLENVQQAMDKEENQLKITINTWEQFERDKETIVKYLSHASSALERILSFSSLESLSSELEKTKELSKQTVAMAIEAENLVKKSFAIQLGEKSKQNLQQEAKSIQEQLEKVEATIEEDIKTMEKVKNKWDQFGKSFEALSIWITEKEKELDTLETSSSSLDVQINQIKDMIKEIDARNNEIPKLEEDVQSFSQYLTSGESAHIKAKLTQIRRYSEELQDRAQHLEGAITGKASVQQKFEENLRKFQQDLCRYETKLAELDTSCSSSAETYKVLQDLMDLSQVVEKMNQTLASLSSGSRKITNKEKASQDVLMLQQRHEGVMKQAKDRQASLETHLAQWQRLEKELSTFLTWLERCEASAKPIEQYVSADRVKLESELQVVQNLQVDVASHASVYTSLLQLNELLIKTNPNESVKKFKKDLEELDRRWNILPQTVSKRISFLQSVVAEHKQYDELLQRFSDWIKQFLGKLHSTSEINTSDQQPALYHNKDHKKEVEGKSKELQSLKSHVEKLCSFSRPEDHSVFQNKAEDCLQLYQEASQVIIRRQDVLPHLKTFLELHSATLHMLQHLRQTVETTGNINKSKSEVLEKELSEVIQAVSKLESTAASLDASLTKAQYHLKHGSSEQRTSCRNIADCVCIELESIQSLLGTKQNEAEALRALHTSVKERKEHLLKSIEDLEERADKEGLKEPTLQEVQQRQEQCFVLIDLIRKYQSLKSTVTKVIEVASNVAGTKTTIKDQEDVKWALSKHEATKNELNDRQKELDAFSSKGKHLLAELKKIPNCDPLMIKTDMDSTVDKWLDVSDKLEDSIEKLRVSVSLWEDVLTVGDDIDEELPMNLQFLEADLRKKMVHAKEMCEMAKETIKNYNFQTRQLHNFVTQMEDWLTKMEESLLSCAHSQDPSGLSTVKAIGALGIQKELQQQQGNFDSTQETLNSLCRKYPSVELETIGGTVTSLMKKYEAVNQLSLKTQASMQESLEKHFQQSMHGFQNWYSNLKIAVKDLTITSGDGKATEAKFHELQKVLESVNDGKSKLDAVSQEGECLCTYLPKSSVTGIQEQIAKAHQDFEGLLKQCLKDKQALEECVAELESFEDLCKNRSLWLREMEERISTEALGESKQHIPDKKNEVKKVEAFLHEILIARESFDKLTQKSQVLNEKGYNAGREIRLASQHFSAYQNLTKAVKEKLKASQAALQEHQAFEEAVQNMWSWLKNVQEKLASVEGTTGSKTVLEKHLLQIQEILLMKGEGEVKLNMTIGKGEQAIKSSNEEGQKEIQNQLEALKDLWSSIISTSVTCQSLLESVVNQWNDYLERKNQLNQWLESADHKVEQPLDPQNGLKEKFSQLDYFQAIVSEIEDHSKDLQQLIGKARELREKTEDDYFREDAQEELKTQLSDITTVAKEKMRRIEDIVKDHLLYLDAVHEFTDWLHSAKEELHRWSDTSGDAAALQKKLTKINLVCPYPAEVDHSHVSYHGNIPLQELIDSRRTGESRLNRVQMLAPAVKQNTTTQGCKDIDAEMQALKSDWKQWEDSLLQTQKDLQELQNQMALSEQEFTTQAAQLEEALQHFSMLLSTWLKSLTPLDSKHTDKEIVGFWHQEKEVLDELTKAEHMNDDIKTQLNDLCRFSKDLSIYSAKVSQLIKEYNSLCLQASKGCLSKEQALQQRFRTAFRDFQQWLVNSKITTAKCFDAPQSVSEAAANIQKIQEFLSETESGQHKLNLVVSKGELLSSVLPKEKAKSIQAKVASAKEDWKKFISMLHQKETTLENLKVQMKDFETSAEPLQEWLNATQKTVQETSNRLHDLPAKKREQQKLQSVLEEIRCHESQLNKLKEKAQQLWEEQAASKNFMHRVSQLSSQYLSLSNVAKEKVSRMDRIVAEHQQFSHDLKELQDWMADAIQMLESYCHPTADKNALDSRMAKLEGLLSVKQEKEIQMKMVLTRGESVLENTSLEGVPIIEQQLRTLKDSWASLLSACIHCKSHLEGALSKWTSYQDDVRQFTSWMDKVEAIMNASERQRAELREKTSSLSKSKEAITKAEEMVHLHNEYQRNLKTLEIWLEKEQDKLHYLSHLEGDTERHEATLRELQVLQVECAEGQALLNAALHVREQVVPWGIPQLEDRILESVRQDWTVYQHKLAEVRTQLNTILSKVRLMENKFLKVDEWIKTLEGKVYIRTGRQSDRATKEMQLQQMKKWHEEITVYKDEVEEVGLLAQQILEESNTSSRTGRQAAHLASRYQALILHVLEQIKFLEEEIHSMEESELAFITYKDWFGATHRKFRNVITKSDVVDKTAMEKKMQKLEDLMSDMDVGHNLLKSAREKGEKAIKYMERNEAEQLKREISDCVEQLNEMTCCIRKEHTTLEKCLHLTKEFLDKYKAQTQWLSEYQSILHITVDAKMELFEKKAQLSKYKSIQQTVLSHEPSIKNVSEKGECLLELVHDANLAESIQKLQTEYQELCTIAKTQVANLEGKVKQHEDYNSDLQEVEKWLLQMSSRLVTPDLMENSNLEIITQHLASHKAMMDEIAGFEDHLNSLKNKGDCLISECAEHLQAKFKQNIETQLQGTRDSYSAICSTAQRMYQSLENELQKHVNHQDTLQQCQVWLSAVRPELKPIPRPPFSLVDAVKQIEDRIMNSQYLAQGWEEIKQMKAELWICFQDIDQQLQNMKRRGAELELNIAQNMVLQVKEFSQKLQSKQAALTALTEKVSKLTQGQESPEHKEVGHLSSHWLDLCLQTSNVLLHREEDLQRTKDYHDRLNVVEVFLEKFTQEWDHLARSDAESTTTHLEALRKLALALQERRFALEDLKEQKQKMIEHLNLDDRELVKEQSGHFEQHWIQLEDLIKRKIQLSVTTLEELSMVQSKIQELMEWAEEQQPSISEALKHSPPSELAQNFLMDHLTICSEVEAKQLVLKGLIKDVDRVMTNLGLNERQMLQKCLLEAQNHVDCLSELVGQRRKHLNKALSERTQFILATFQAMNQIQQHERKIMFHEHICLLPEDVSKQIRTCKCAHASLKAYQSEISGLWSQGRDLMKDTTEQEKSEVLNKLQELQNTYDTIVEKCSQRLIELEKHMVSRKYFKEDLDKACHWVKQSDIVSFPEINLMNSNSELYSQLAKYNQILEQFPEYENLLLTLQKVGQEILPSLNEMDHSYLEEKLNALPQQFSVIIALAKDKFCKVQEAIWARKEYASLIEMTTRALSELEDQIVSMHKTPSTLLAEEVVSLQQDYRNVLTEVVNLGAAVDELNQKKEAFRSTGQPWLPEEMLQLTTLYHKLKRQIEQKVNQLDDMMEAYQEHEKMCKQLEIQLNSINEEQAKLNEETLPAEEKLKMYHSLAGSLQDTGILLKHIAEHLEMLSSQLDPSVHEEANNQVRTWQEMLKTLHTAIGDTVMECENRLVQSIDFQTEICRSLEWLRHIKAELIDPLSIDLKLNDIQEEIRKVQIQQEEVQSSLRIMRALSNKEKEKYIKAKELIPAHLENSLAELSELDAEVQEAVHMKQEKLSKLYSLGQRYYHVIQAASDWLEDAQESLQLVQNGLDMENSEENLRNHIEFFSTKKQFQVHLQELWKLVSDMEPFLQALGKEELTKKMEALEEKEREMEQEAQSQKELLQRCVSQWQEYQIARQHVIDLMNESEKKLSEFSVAKATSILEAEEKLISHKSLVSTVNSFHEKITSLEEKACHLEKMGNDASKATISRSMTTVWQRWTKLRSVSQEQERILDESMQKWNEFNDKMQKATDTLDHLQDRLPETSVEKASKNELLDLLDYHSNFILELEQQLSSLGLLKQHAFSMLRDTEVAPASQEQMPIMQEIKAMQDRCHNMQQKVKRSGKVIKQELKEREEVEREINKVKSWIQEAKEYLLNPSTEVNTQLEELQALVNEATIHRQAVEKMAEQQQNKYLGLYTILPSELSLQLAEVGLALVNIHEQVQAKEKEAQQSKTLNQEFGQKIQEIAKELNSILVKLKEKTSNITQAKIDQKVLGEELDSCNIKLMELDAAVQDFAEPNPQLSKQLTSKIGKLTELHQQTIRQAEYRASKLNQAISHLEEYNEMLEFILKWIEKANILIHGNITWNSAAQLRDQITSHQTMLEESGEIHGDLEAMNEKIEYLASVYLTEGMAQQVLELGRQTEELQQEIKKRLHNIQDAAKDMKKFETEVKALQAALEKAQATLTSSEIGRLTLKEQLSHRQEAVVQYEQYEQELKHLQQLIERAHREIQDKPISTSNIQELQAQISRHEELAQKIKGYQEQIASLNSKCKMLTMKAKHATMLLTVTEVEGLSEGMEELDSEELLSAHTTHPSVVMMTAGRCHTLLSPVTEESGEEGTNSEISSPPACRSPSPVANTDASVNQ